MANLLAALRQALLSRPGEAYLLRPLAPEEFYMTKAQKGLMRQVSTSEVNTPHIKQGKIKSVANSLKLIGFTSTETPFQWFGYGR